MTIQQTRRATQTSGVALTLAMLASCVAPPKPVVAPPPVPRPVPALPAAPPQQDWRDIALTPGTWTWRGGAGETSIAQ
jgi:hypothetical protein